MNNQIKAILRNIVKNRLKMKVKAFWVVLFTTLGEGFLLEQWMVMTIGILIFFLFSFSIDYLFPQNINGFIKETLNN